MLDLDSVRLFLLAAEFGNLTRAAEAAGTVQPVVSQRLKALEATLGRRLLDRSPRYVRLTPAGAAFLDRARALMAAHDAAVAPEGAAAPVISLAVSDHALGTSFDIVLGRMRAALPPQTQITLRLGQSQAVRSAYESGEADLAILRRESPATEGEVLGTDPLGWRAAAAWVAPPGALPLILLPPPCGVRAAAIRACETAGLPWREAFTGGSCLALVAAARAGLGIAPIGRIVGADLPEVGDASGLPSLPSSEIVLLARTPDAATAAAARALAASLRETLRNPGQGRGIAGAGSPASFTASIT